MQERRQRPPTQLSGQSQSLVVVQGPSSGLLESVLSQLPELLLPLELLAPMLVLPLLLVPRLELVQLLLEPEIELDVEPLDPVELPLLLDVTPDAPLELELLLEVPLPPFEQAASESAARRQENRNRAEVDDMWGNLQRKWPSKRPHLSILLRAFVQADPAP